MAFNLLIYGKNWQILNIVFKSHNDHDEHSSSMIPEAVGSEMGFKEAGCR